MNEREVKMGLAQGVCSVSGKPCRCGDGGGCSSYRTSVDNLPTALVHRLRTLQLHLQVCQQDCDWVADYDARRRIWPQPEVRDIRRKLETAEAILKEILG